MKKIGITGGKGGVGKSTVAILLANKLRSKGEKVILCDCDVECPNDYLLLGEKLKSPAQKVYAQFPQLDESKCIKCGLCARNCRSNAIFEAPGQYPLFLHELCSGCGLCWHLCPHQAIKIEKKVIGEIFENNVKCQSLNVKSTTQISKLNNFYLVTGKSVGVVEETGPIVSQTRRYAEDLGKKINADYLLIDTAVGMHCGVIRALINVDLAYAVTEPTPLGTHDLKLILELLKKLKVPAQIVLNQADLGNRRPIDQIAQHLGVKIAYEIPYSKEILNAYSKGELSEVNIL